MKKLTKEEALNKIEELKKYVNDKEVEETKKVSFEIKSIWGGILYTSEKETQREAILEAVERGANLSGADLRDADLSDADLSDANLRGANLRGAELDHAKFYGKGGTVHLKKAQVPVFLQALGFIIED